MNTKLVILVSLFLLCFKSKSQIVSTIAGTGSFPDSGDGGLALLANIDEPTDVKLDKRGNIFISEQFFGIRKINKNGIITSPGPIYGFETFVIDSIGNIYFPGGNLVSKIDTSLNVTIFAGGGTKTLSGIPATQAGLNKPHCVAFDNKQNNFYIGDLYRISKVDKFGIINTIAGTIGVSGYSGDSGLAIYASISVPQSMVFDKKGNLFIADLGNNIIRKIDINGIITTFAGNGNAGFSGDNGPAINASFVQPYGLAFDSHGNLFISDQSNNRIRKVDTFGIITTYAGGKWGGNADGPSLQASFQYPAGLAIDSADNLYVADFGNNLIRKITPANSVPVVIKNYTVIASESNQSVSNEWQTTTEINTAYYNVQRSTDGLTFYSIGKVDAKGASTYTFKDPHTTHDSRFTTLYYRLEIVDKNGALSYSEIRHVVLSDNNEISIYPNPTKDLVRINGKNILSVKVSDIVGRMLINQSFNNTVNPAISLKGLVAGVYYLTITTTDGKEKTLVLEKR